MAAECPLAMPTNENAPVAADRGVRNGHLGGGYLANSNLPRSVLRNLLAGAFAAISRMIAE
jgi:hypothetical protein